MNDDLSISIIKDFIVLLFKIEKMDESQRHLIYKSLEFKQIYNKLNSISHKDLIDISYRHKIIEFLFENKFIESNLNDLHLKFKLIYREIFLKNLKNISYTKKILEIFKKKKIEVIVLKGIALSLQTKNKYTSRISKDLDLFINPRDLINSLKLLNSNGYIIKHNYFPKKIKKIFPFFFKLIFYEITLENKSNDFHYIDLHWKLANYNSALPDFEAAFSKSDSIFHNNVKFNSLNHVESLKYSCANVAKDKWLCLGNLLDIHFLANRLSQPELLELIKYKEVKISLYATYLFTNDEHYNFEKFLNIFERFYISKVCAIFQGLDIKSKGLEATKGFNKIVSFFHEFYLANSFSDFVLLIIRSIWYLIPVSLKFKFRNKIKN